jgi:Holliday junction resolvase RusA-like endonuclease
MSEPFFITFSVPGAPVAKGRPRLSARGGLARAYTPSKTRHYEDLIRIAAGEAMGQRAPIEDAVVLTITAFVAAPKAMSRAKRALALDGTLKPITRPDADNYAKAALDACNAILFRDDSQVADLIIRKRFSDRPRLVVTMEVESDA